MAASLFQCNHKFSKTSQFALHTVQLANMDLQLVVSQSKKKNMTPAAPPSQLF